MENIIGIPAEFTSALSENAEAEKFFNSCTVIQRDSILSQTQKLCTYEEMQAFVNNLPSSAL